MPPPSEPIPAAIYARYSTLRQNALSIDDQLRRCGEVAKHHGCAIVDVFADAAESGATMNRPEWKRLVGEARGSHCRFRTVLVDDLSRLDAAFFTMNGIISIVFFLCVLTERLTDHGVALYAVHLAR